MTYNAVQTQPYHGHFAHFDLSAIDASNRMEQHVVIQELLRLWQDSHVVPVSIVCCPVGLEVATISLMQLCFH